MAYRSYNQPPPCFRKVENQRGKTIDRMTKEMKIGNKYNPWKSIYTKDYNKWNRRNNSSSNAFRPGTSQVGRRTDLDNLNDAVSERSFEIRGEGIKSHNEYAPRPVIKNRNNLGSEVDSSGRLLIRVENIYIESINYFFDISIYFDIKLFIMKVDNRNK